MSAVVGHAGIARRGGGAAARHRGARLPCVTCGTASYYDSVLLMRRRRVRRAAPDRVASAGTRSGSRGRRRATPCRSETRRRGREAAGPVWPVGAERRGPGSRARVLAPGRPARFPGIRHGRSRCWMGPPDSGGRAASRHRSRRRRADHGFGRGGGSGFAGGHRARRAGDARVGPTRRRPGHLRDGRGRAVPLPEPRPRRVHADRDALRIRDLRGGGHPGTGRGHHRTPRHPPACAGGGGRSR